MRGGNARRWSREADVTASAGRGAQICPSPSTVMSEENENIHKFAGSKSKDQIEVCCQNTSKPYVQIMKL